jgi:hypothetical protein
MSINKIVELYGFLLSEGTEEEQERQARNEYPDIITAIRYLKRQRRKREAVKLVDTCKPDIFESSYYEVK